MKKAALLIALCLSMIALTTPNAKSIPAKTDIQSITIVSPQNNTVFNTASSAIDVSLEFHIDIPRRGLVALIGYSLNGTYKGTILGNTTILVARNATYRLTVNATDILGEECISDPVYFTVTLPCDLIIVGGSRGKMDMPDIVAFAAAYGTKIGDPYWNPKADIAYPYGAVNLLDLVTAISHYNKTYWP
jgi:hypothetical protein